MLSRVTPVTDIVAGFTVTVQLAVLLPSAVVTVMVAVPAATGVTNPFATVATLSLFELQVTALFVALLGATVAVSVSAAPPTVSVRVVLSSVTPITDIGFTVTLAVA